MTAEEKLKVLGSVVDGRESVWCGVCQGSGNARRDNKHSGGFISNNTCLSCDGVGKVWVDTEVISLWTERRKLLLRKQGR